MSGLSARLAIPYPVGTDPITDYPALAAAAAAALESKIGLVPLYDNVAAVPIASWDIASIPATYKHLRLVLQARGDAAVLEATAAIRFNNDATAVYDWGQLTATSAVSGSATFGATSARVCDYPCASAAAGLVATSVIDIPNYAAAVFHKAWTAQASHKRGVAAGDLQLGVFHGQYRNVAAINRITIFSLGGAVGFAAGSRFSIFGLF